MEKMKKNILHELYGAEARKRKEIKDTKEETQKTSKKETLEEPLYLVPPPKPSKRHVVCPMCASPDVSWDLSKDACAGASLFNQHKCNNCGYTGIFFPELTKKELEKLLKEKEK
ncbi:MAG: hypothetical protein MSIBF_06150 [Candidatus Altiarchaeales archaeon IMC4]|nr:MAG: hypothetical protein MSIBF_06150 [Candidatus Altiarchaeales archaeon IMC4]